MNTSLLYLTDEEVTEALLEATLDNLPPTKSGAGFYIERASLENVMRAVVWNFMRFRGIRDGAQVEVVNTILRFYFDRHLLSAGWDGRRFPSHDVKKRFVKDVIAACKIFGVFSNFNSEVAAKVLEVLHTQKGPQSVA